MAEQAGFEPQHALYMQRLRSTSSEGESAVCAIKRNRLIFTKGARASKPLRLDIPAYHRPQPIGFLGLMPSPAKRRSQSSDVIHIMNELFLSRSAWPIESH